jgi:putative flippase GtrA
VGHDAFARISDPSMSVSRALEVIRYLATGTLCVALNVVIIVLLTERLRLHYLLSIFVCFVLVTSVGFCLNRVWTFRKRATGAHRDLARYVVVALTQIPVSLVACGICVELLHIPYPMAVVLVGGVFAPATYLVHRRWSFGLRRAQQHS